MVQDYYLQKEIKSYANKVEQFQDQGLDTWVYR